MRIRKKFKFEAAHRLCNSYTTRCRGIHGHSYKVELIIRGQPSTSDGMVMDFALVSDKFRTIIDYFDHSLILSKDDPLLSQMVTPKLPVEQWLGALNPRYIIVPYEPTAEMMAHHFAWYWEHGGSQLPPPDLIAPLVSSVIVHETESGYAAWDEYDRPVEARFDETVFSPAILDWGPDDE